MNLVSFFAFHAVKMTLRPQKKSPKTCQSHFSAARSEIARRSKDTADRMKDKMREAKEEVESEQLNKLDISSGNLPRPVLYSTLCFVIRAICWAGVTFAVFFQATCTISPAVIVQKYAESFTFMIKE